MVEMTRQSVEAQNRGHLILLLRGPSEPELVLCLGSGLAVVVLAVLLLCGFFECVPSLPTSRSDASLVLLAISSLSKPRRRRCTCDDTCRPPDDSVLLNNSNCLPSSDADSDSDSDAIDLSESEDKDEDEDQHDEEDDDELSSLSCTEDDVDTTDSSSSMALLLVGILILLLLVYCTVL